MTTQARLVGICQYIAEERERDGNPLGEVCTYDVESNQATFYINNSRVAVLTWFLEGPHVGQIKVTFDSVERPGDVRLMYVNAAMWPEGDFQVGDTIGDQL